LLIRVSQEIRGNVQAVEDVTHVVQHPGRDFGHARDARSRNQVLVGRGQFLRGLFAGCNILEDTNLLNDRASGVANDRHRKQSPDHAAVGQKKTLLQCETVGGTRSNTVDTRFLATGVVAMHQPGEQRVVHFLVLRQSEDAAKRGVEMKCISEIGSFPGDADGRMFEDKTEEGLALL
jgi:hypothetical protein